MSPFSGCLASLIWLLHAGFLLLLCPLCNGAGSFWSRDLQGSSYAKAAAGKLASRRAWSSHAWLSAPVVRLFLKLILIKECTAASGTKSSCFWRFASQPGNHPFAVLTQTFPVIFLLCQELSSYFWKSFLLDLILEYVNKWVVYCAVMTIQCISQKPKYSMSITTP